MSEKTRLSRRTVQELIRKLLESGELKTDDERHSGRGPERSRWGTVRYRINVDKLEEKSDERRAKKRKHGCADSAQAGTGGSAQKSARGCANSRAPGAQAAAHNPSLEPSGEPSINERASDRPGGDSLKGTTRPPLPQVPLEIWMCEEKQLVKHVEAWFLREQIGLRIESDLHEELLAAILATRHEHRSNPQSYAAKCFANGVAMGFQLSAQKLLGGPKNQYAAHG